VSTSEKTEILVVEDNRLTRHLLAKQLESGGFCVLQAESLQAALELFGRHRPAAVTVDLQLGEQSGEEVMRQILARDPTARIVVITAEAPLETRERLLREGARGYLEKPLLDAARVLGEIQRALAGEQAPAEAEEAAPAGSAASRETYFPALRPVVHEVVGTTLGMDITDTESGDASTLALSALSSLAGSWKGAIRIACDRGLVRELAVKLFDLGTDTPADDDLEDALAEFCNIVVGNLKATLPAACNHSVPKVEALPSASPASEPQTQAFWFSTPDGSLVLSVIPALPDPRAAEGP